MYFDLQVPKQEPPYIVRICKRQYRGRHVAVETYRFDSECGAHLFAVKQGLDPALTVDLFYGSKFLRSYTHLKVA